MPIYPQKITSIYIYIYISYIHPAALKASSNYVPEGPYLLADQDAMGMQLKSRAQVFELKL